MKLFRVETTQVQEVTSYSYYDDSARKGYTVEKDIEYHTQIKVSEIDIDRDTLEKDLESYKKVRDDINSLSCISVDQRSRIMDNFPGHISGRYLAKKELRTRVFNVKDVLNIPNTLYVEAWHGISKIQIIGSVTGKVHVDLKRGSVDKISLIGDTDITPIREMIETLLEEWKLGKNL